MDNDFTNRKTICDGYEIKERKSKRGSQSNYHIFLFQLFLLLALFHYFQFIDNIGSSAQFINAP